MKIIFIPKKLSHVLPEDAYDFPDLLPSCLSSVQLSDLSPHPHKYLSKASYWLVERVHLAHQSAHPS